jgi:hypothetical protein
MGDRPHRTGRSRVSDEALLSALRGALAAAEPLPAHVPEAARMAFSLRGLPVLQASGRRSPPEPDRRGR